jgi:hypothetical protein
MQKVDSCLTMNSRWLAIWPEAPVTATRTVFCQFLVREGSSCSQQHQQAPKSASCCKKHMGSGEEALPARPGITYVGSVVCQLEDTILLQLLVLLGRGCVGCWCDGGCGR